MTPLKHKLKLAVADGIFTEAQAFAIEQMCEFHNGTAIEDLPIGVARVIDELMPCNRPSSARACPVGKKVSDMVRTLQALPQDADVLFDGGEEFRGLEVRLSSPPGAVIFTAK